MLGSTISQAQGAFVKGRQILDAALVANEVVEKGRKHNKTGLIFKLTSRKL